ncbi:isoamylase 1, chloroplastic isoform X2 [Ricinus communis]|uniref:isoamylase 1, chloroplastic isoform X2 n=1 Tax=Ricinus communis TaxID=3988 RepID=UPI00201A97AE|nr:isoamylase 1, chloroplastic isoform X2 [Ricinus communis]
MELIQFATSSRSLSVPVLNSYCNKNNKEKECGEFVNFTSTSRIRIRIRSRCYYSVVTKAARRDEVETAVVVDKPKFRRYQVSEGHPAPFGATIADGGVNFAIYSSDAVSASLCLISLDDLTQNRVSEEIALDPVRNRTGDIWHVFLKGDFKDTLYGYRFDGVLSPHDGHYFDSSQIVLDPYAKAVISRGEFGVLGPGDNCWPQMAGMIPSASQAEFDWEGDLPLKYPQKDLVIYEMHVRGFTRHESSRTEFPGTYLATVEKLDHLKVIMDVVFNHTAEGNQKGPILSFRGVDNSVYYMLAPKGEFYNYSGCGNTFNCNHPIVRQFILDCLRYWVLEMHVDGFRFDLASIMTRGSSLWDAVNVFGNPIEGDLLTTGTPLSSPPLIDMISNDPILHGVKLVAEAWDTGGLYQVGSFPHWQIWSEWNGKYRDVVRQFIKGTDGFSGAFAECLCGSPNLYQEGGRKPWNSINFICAHDGFTLADLVSYNNKNNLANGEDNNDGESHNNSWNCGQEGEFASILVKKLRKRQMRNFFVCLMVSQGVPMIYMGDEYGHTKGGNNNTYCHDNYINYFRWDKKEESSSDFYRFCRLMTKFRHECESLGLNDFPTAERLQWHGHSPGMPDWSETSRFVAFTLNDSVKGEIYVAFNANHLPVTIALPEQPGYRWQPLVDTGKPAPFDFFSSDIPDRDIAYKQYAHFLDANLYPMLSYSSVILTLSPDDIA